MILDSLDALPGLLPGSFRGRLLHVLDASSEPGRRVLEYLFPGVDQSEYDDFGLLPMIVTIDALVIGDDYKAQVKALQRAFETPGPGQLIHPWLGPMTVMVDEPPSISFSSRELRVARINARFKRISTGSAVSALVSGLDPAIAGLISSASSLVATVTTGVLSSVRSSAARRSARIFTTAASQVTPVPEGLRLLPQIRATIAASSPQSPVAFDDWVSGAVSVLTEVVVQPAVAPRAEPPPQPSASARIAIASDLAGRLNAAAMAAPSDADAALLLSASARLLAAAAQQSAYAEFTSRRDAIAYRTVMTTALSDLVDRTEALGARTYQATASQTIRAARRLSAALVTDISEVIGRLPDVLVFTADREEDAWQVAQHIAGDKPDRIEEVYLDIVARNRPAHPARLDAGRIEALEIR